MSKVIDYIKDLIKENRTEYSLLHSYVVEEVSIKDIADNRKEYTGKTYIGRIIMYQYVRFVVEVVRVQRPKLFELFVETNSIAVTSPGDVKRTISRMHDAVWERKQRSW